MKTPMICPLGARGLPCEKCEASQKRGGWQFQKIKEKSSLSTTDLHPTPIKNRFKSCQRIGHELIFNCHETNKKHIT